jgi:hypothetical protein
VPRARPAITTVLALAGAALAVTTPVRAEIGGGTFTATGDDTTPRFFHRATALPDHRVLVSGGMSFTPIPPSLVSLAELSFFDPATSTYSTSFAPIDGGGTVTPVLATPRSSHTQTTLRDGRVLITGGHTGASGTSPGTAVAGVEIFDPYTGVVSGGPAMSSTRAAHTATRVDDGPDEDLVVVAGGATWEVYGTATGGWAGPYPLERTRAGHAAVALADGSVLLVGGSGTGPTTLERLDPVAGTSALMTATLTVGVDDLAAVRLADDGVLIVGGQDLSDGDTVDLSYRYDPVADSIAPIAPPPDRADGISDHQLVRLGRYAMVFGGEAQTAGVDTELDYAALYDPAGDAWVFTATMEFVHDDFAAVVLPDSRVVLVGGGADFLGTPLPTPKSETFTPTSPEPADLDCDGAVDFADLLLLLVAWGPCPDPPLACPGDINDDGTVDFNDLLLLLVAWS